MIQFKRTSGSLSSQQPTISSKVLPKVHNVGHHGGCDTRLRALTALPGHGRCNHRGPAPIASYMVFSGGRRATGTFVRFNIHLIVEIVVISINSSISQRSNVAFPQTLLNTPKHFLSSPSSTRLPSSSTLNCPSTSSRTHLLSIPFDLFPPL